MFRLVSLKPETDIVALSAFMLALLSATAQFYEWARGPDVSSLGTDRVALWWETAQNGSQYVRVAAPLSYVNTAASAYAAILSSESVTMSFGKHKSAQLWVSFGTFQRVNGSLAVRTSAPAIPAALSGQSAISHITLFAPLTHDCNPHDKNCSAMMDYIYPSEIANLPVGSTITFDFESAFFKRKAISFSCILTVSATMLAHWNKSGSALQLCNAPTE